MRKCFTFLLAILCSLAHGQFTDSLVLDCVQIEPHTVSISMYEKMEWGIKLPASTEDAINNWISNDQKRTRLQPALNPFDPDQVDVYGIITTPSGKIERVNAFFYIDFIRDTNDPDKNRWDWRSESTPYRYRLRYAAHEAGEHKITFFLAGPGNKNIPSPERSFEAKPAPANKGLVKASPNHHYYAYADNTVFFPVGMNINQLSYNCMCDNQESRDCETCYDKGKNDPCCGVDPDARVGNNNAQVLRKQCAPVAAYLKFEQVREELVAAGANTFRFVLEPRMFDIEFEKMNNYFDRQYQAWEMDKMFEDCHKKGLHIQWNLQLHIPITITSYGDERWDFDDVDVTGKRNPKDNGWCYKRECGLKDPVAFLENDKARANYKKKIRYMIARWGYNPDVYLIELMSEMNNIGGGDRWILHDEDEDGEFEDWKHFDNKSQQWVDTPERKEHFGLPRPYYSDPQRTRPAVAQWHNEMARFIKEELGHKQHLIAADYTGQAPFETYPDNTNPCASQFFDDSWNSPYIDVCAISNYGGDFNRWEHMASDEFKKYLCTNNTPEQTFGNLTKIISYGENGIGNYMDCDITGYVKDLIAISLSGHASSGMSWDESKDRSYWYFMGVTNMFMQNYVLKNINLGSENWTPGYVLSKKNWWDKRNRSSKHNQRAEALYLHMNAERRTAIVGVIMNRTWNAYTAGDSYCIDQNAYKTMVEGRYDQLGKFEAISAKEEAITLTDIPKGKYEIDYIHPITGQVIKTIKASSRGGEITLEEYPVLDKDLRERPPFCFFVIRPI